MDFSFATVITTGQLSIAFSPTTDAALVNAIHVESAGRGPTLTPTPTPTRTNTPSPTDTPVAPFDLRINAGGPAWVDSGGNTWLGDKPYAAGSWGHEGGSTYGTTAAIGNTADDALFQSERYWGTEGGYAIDLPNGMYRVQLRFAEIYYTYAGRAPL